MAKRKITFKSLHSANHDLYVRMYELTSNECLSCIPPIQIVSGICCSVDIPECRLFLVRLVPRISHIPALIPINVFPFDAVSFLVNPD